MQNIKRDHGSQLYGILTSLELQDYLQALDASAFTVSPSAHEAYYDLMDACHHATAGIGLDAFLGWSAGAAALRNKAEGIRKRWNSIQPDHGKTVYHLARECRLAGDMRLEQKLALYRPSSLNRRLRNMVNNVRETADAVRVIDELASMDDIHPYQVNVVISQLAKKVGVRVSTLHDDYDVAKQAHAQHGISWPHYTLTKTGKVTLLTTYENFKHLLKLHHIRIRHNLMTGMTEVDVAGASFSQYLPRERYSYSELHSYAAQHGLRFGQTLLRDYVARYAAEPDQSYHPVAAWLESGQWDGKDWLGVALDCLQLENISPEDARAYLSAWLLGAIDAVTNPKGIGRQSLLALFGPSGCGKTLFFLSLLPVDKANDWACTGETWPLTPQETHVEWIKFVMRYWLVEINSLSWADLSQLGPNRDLLARNVDDITLYYGQKIQQRRYRRTVFYASVSSDKPISKFPDDPSLRVIPVKQVRKPERINPVQLWQQMYCMYKEGNNVAA